MSDSPPRACWCFICDSTVTVSGDATLLMAEMLRVFVRGKQFVWLCADARW